MTLQLIYVTAHVCVSLKAVFWFYLYKLIYGRHQITRRIYNTRSIDKHYLGKLNSEELDKDRTLGLLITEFVISTTKTIVILINCEDPMIMFKTVKTLWLYQKL